jgi:hypothetical protein
MQEKTQEIERRENRFYRPLKDRAYCMPIKLKKPCAVKGWLGLLYAQDFLTLLPSPKGLLSIVAAYRGLQLAIAACSGFLSGRHIPCSWVERARPAPASATDAQQPCFFIRPPQRGRCAPICAPYSSLRPSHSPPPLFAHLLHLRSTFTAVVHFFIFNRRLQKLRKQRRCQKDIPLMPAH